VDETGDSMPAPLSLDDDAFLRLLVEAGPRNLRFTSFGLGRSHRWESGDRCLNEQILWFFLASGVEGFVEGEPDPVIIPEGSFHWLSAGVRHQLQKLDDAVVLRNFLLRFELRHRGRAVRPQWTRAGLADFSAGRFWMEQIYETSQVPERDRFERLRAVLVALWIDLRLARTSAWEPEPDRRRFTPGEVRELHRYVEAHLHRGFLQVELARVLRLSPDYFARKFRATFSLSPREWLTRKRLERAANLLIETRLGVAEIAAETGFNDPRFFARQFRRLFGKSPIQYRNQR